jgi:hypothetical protein
MTDIDLQQSLDAVMSGHNALAEMNNKIAAQIMAIKDQQIAALTADNMGLTGARERCAVLDAENQTLRARIKETGEAYADALDKLAACQEEITDLNE